MPPIFSTLFLLVIVNTIAGLRVFDEASVRSPVTQLATLSALAALCLFAASRKPRAEVFDNRLIPETFVWGNNAEVWNQLPVTLVPNYLVWKSLGFLGMDVLGARRFSVRHSTSS